jgi:hypothetical protein
MAGGGPVTDFEAICLAVPRAPFFLLFYAGADSGRAARLRAAITGKAELRQFVQASSREEAAELLAHPDLRVGWFDGCLLVVWDLDAPTVGEARDWLRGLPKWPSGQVATFLVAEEEPALSFQDLLAFIDRDFADVGDFDACLDIVGRWCSPGGPLDLGLPFHKRPSRWLRDLKHDYIGNLVLIFRETLEGLGLLAAQREIDFIASVLRNLLSPVESRIAVRGLTAESEEEESALYQSIYSTPFRIVAPASLGRLLAEEYTEGVDYVLYPSLDDAAGLLNAAGEEGCARVLLRLPGRQEPALRPAPPGSPGELPIVLVGESELRLGWHAWQARLAANRIGFYAVSELEGRRSGKPILVTQRPYWRACAFLSLQGLFDRLVELIAQTHAAIRPEAPKLKEQVFRSLAAVGSARALYLGQTRTGDGS